MELSDSWNKRWSRLCAVAAELFEALKDGDIRAMWVVAFQLALIGASGFVLFAQIEPSFSIHYSYTYKVKIDGDEVLPALWGVAACALGCCCFV